MIHIFTSFFTMFGIHLSVNFMSKTSKRVLVRYYPKSVTDVSGIQNFMAPNVLVLYDVFTAVKRR